MDADTEHYLETIQNQVAALGQFITDLTDKSNESYIELAAANIALYGQLQERDEYIQLMARQTIAAAVAIQQMAQKGAEVEPIIVHQNGVWTVIDDEEEEWNEEEE